MATSALNQRGEWVPAIPLPYYGLRKHCSCGRKFWTAAGYQGHYALAHVLALVKVTRDEPPAPFLDEHDIAVIEALPDEPDGPCPCGHAPDDICLNGLIYVSCGHENCGGACEEGGRCGSLPGCCDPVAAGRPVT